jgi:hypothetical protein
VLIISGSSAGDIIAAAEEKLLEISAMRENYA